MNHQELLDDKNLKRIPMASIVMAVNLAMEHVPEQYVVGHLAFKALSKWVADGGSNDRLLVLRMTLHDEVERARKLFLVWDNTRKNAPPPAPADHKKTSKKVLKEKEKMEMGPLYAYMALRALEGMVNVALGGKAGELVDVLECLDDVPSVAGADPKKVESLTVVLQSLDDIFDRNHWKAIVDAA